MEPGMPTSLLYLPVYTLDGAKWHALEPHTDKTVAKSRLRSAMPPPGYIDYIPGGWDTIQCGLYVVDLKRVPDTGLISFPTKEFLSSNE